MRQTRQGGSSVVFILVGVLLAALLVGGVYILRQQTAQKPIAVTPQPQNVSPLSEKPQEDTKKESPSSDQALQKDSSQKQTDNQSPQASAAELPRTGGSKDIGLLVSIALLTGTCIAYVNSRRAAARLSF